MAFSITGKRSGVEASFRVETAAEALASFHRIYELNYLFVRVRDSRGKTLNRDDLLRLVALEKVGQHAPRP